MKNPSIMPTIAFIPLRGGSKSIPLKNIKPLCGKPLVWYNLFALEKATSIDRVVVATDSTDIKSVVQSFDFKKVEVYDRDSENAQDHSSTESVMLEYLRKEVATKALKVEDRFILVQATSPLTLSNHFNEACYQLEQTGSDSLLSCVRIKRFFWRADGTPLNYDPAARPRRQDFEGDLMENGAFYINTVGNILRDENRLSGKIAVYEMPEHTAIEIDEPDDWIIAERLLQRHLPANVKKAMRSDIRIKLFITDVDGVLTDAGMYYSEHGDEMKKFNTHDGKGLQLLREAGIKTAIITGENTVMVKRRAQKLKVQHVYQGVPHGKKLKRVLEICEKENVKLSEVAYIGDDVNDLDALQAVGLPACPSNALPQVKAVPNILHIAKSGGTGAVRAFAEYVLANHHPKEKT